MEIVKDAAVTKKPVKFEAGKVYFNPDLSYYYLAAYIPGTGFAFVNPETGTSMCAPFQKLEDAEKRMQEDHMYEVPAKLYVTA